MSSTLTPNISSVELGTIIAVVVVVVAGGVYGFVTLRRMVRRWAFGAAREKIRTSWHDVEGLMARGDDMSARLAVMHADAVLDKALQLKCFPGDRFARRLEFAIHKYRSLKRVWWAHRLRNELSHDPHRTLRMGEARKAVATFKQALRELGAL